MTRLPSQYTPFSTQGKEFQLVKPHFTFESTTAISTMMENYINDNEEQR